MEAEPDRLTSWFTILLVFDPGTSTRECINTAEMCTVLGEMCARGRPGGKWKCGMDIWTHVPVIFCDVMYCMFNGVCLVT